MSLHDLRIRFCRNYPLFSESPCMEQFFAQLPSCRSQLEHITHTESLTLNSCFRHPYICGFFILVIACLDSLSYELIWCVILILWHRHLLFPAVDRHKIQCISRIESMGNLKLTLLSGFIVWAVLCELDMWKNRIPLSWHAFYQASQQITQDAIYGLCLSICMLGGMCYLTVDPFPISYMKRSSNDLCLKYHATEQSPENIGLQYI